MASNSGMVENTEMMDFKNDPLWMKLVGIGGILLAFILLYLLSVSQATFGH